MLFGMSTIFLKWSHSSDLIIFRYSCFKIGQSEPRVAYKSIAYKEKSHVKSPEGEEKSNFQYTDFL